MAGRIRKTTKRRKTQSLSTWEVFRRDIERNFKDLSLDQSIISQLQKRIMKVAKHMERDLGVLMKRDVEVLVSKFKRERNKLEKRLASVIDVEVRKLRKIIAKNDRKEFKTAQVKIDNLLKKLQQKQRTGTRKKKAVRKKSTKTVRRNNSAISRKKKKSSR